MDALWKDLFLQAMARGNPERDSEFLALVDQAEGQCSLDVARVLMKSFSSAPDFGTQERVVSVLASAEKSDAIKALLEELPRLLEDANEWAEVLIGQEVDRRPELLLAVARRSSPESKQALRLLLRSPGFDEIYPNAKTIEI